MITSLNSVYQPAKAVHLVAAGVDITVIRSWLGHVSLDTTKHYAANLETKRKEALERLANSSGERIGWLCSSGDGSALRSTLVAKLLAPPITIELCKNSTDVRRGSPKRAQAGRSSATLGQ